MKVEELERYGKTLETFPKEVLKKQNRIVLRAIRSRFGLLGIIPFFVKVFAEQRRLKKNYPHAYRLALDISLDTAKEITMMVAMFNVISRTDGKDQAYAFVKSIFEEIAVLSMPALYQIDDLVQCEGDVFENFMKFNQAWFEAMNTAGTYGVETNERDAEQQAIILNRCANCVICGAFDAPEVAKLGCDHDLAGYPVIMDKVQAEFRRPHTLAKGDAFCDFHFYRQGTAPDTEHLNK